MKKTSPPLAAEKVDVRDACVDDWCTTILIYEERMLGSPIGQIAQCHDFLYSENKHAFGILKKGFRRSERKLSTRIEIDTTILLYIHSKNVYTFCFRKSATTLTREGDTETTDWSDSS